MTMQERFLSGFLSVLFLCGAVAYFLAYFQNRDNSITQVLNKWHRRTSKFRLSNTRTVKLLYAIVMLIVGCVLAAFALSVE